MNKTPGFTIVELMVIMAILAITLAFGLPQITTVVTDNRRVDSLNRLSANLSYARSEAIKRSTPIILKPNTADNWHTGWSIFVDTNGNSAVDAGEPEIRREDPLDLPAKTTIECKLCGDIIYTPDGSPNKAFTLSLVDTLATGFNRDLDIDLVGRVSIKKLK